MKIMLADNDLSIHTIVEKMAERQKIEFVGATSGSEALKLFVKCNPDLVILYALMPDIDGFHVCKEIRSLGSDVLIIMLFSRGEAIDKCIGYDAGCDDYQLKPFSPVELMMRITALLRRHRHEITPIKNRIEVGDLVLDNKRKTVFINGKSVLLTPKEFMILAILASHPGKVFSQEQLVEAVWGKEYVGSTSCIAVFVNKIRDKIEPDATNPQYLQTACRFGYRFGS